MILSYWKLNRQGLKKLFIILLGFLFLISCENKYPDYLKIDNDTYMKLLSFEESDIDVQREDYAAVSILINDNSNLIFRHYKEDIVSLKNNTFSFLIKHLNEGDSAVFKVSTNQISEGLKVLGHGISKSEVVDVSIKVHNYYSHSEYITSKAGFDKEMMEQLLLKKYLDDVSAIKINGIYKELLIEGNGADIKIGDEITIAYKGYFINRLEFDEISGATAFTFKYGTPGQVIKGLDIAIKSMREGEKSKIIIPSQLAFGEEGSTTLIVPSFTSVIYELEILKIN
jgi:FKBP-type peptidyl-prolyl cis-trans isomerase